MKQILLSALLIFSFSISSFATTAKNKDNNLTKQQLIAKFLKLRKEQQEAKMKTAKMKELTKSLEKLSNTLDTNK